MKFKKREIGKISIMVVIICFLLNSKQLFSQGKITKQFNYSDNIIWQNPEWENPEIFQINKEEPTATFYSYKLRDKALINDDWKNSSNYKSLNGKFHNGLTIFLIGYALVDPNIAFTKIENDADTRP